MSLIDVVQRAANNAMRTGTRSGGGAGRELPLGAVRFAAKGLGRVLSVADSLLSRLRGGSRPSPSATPTERGTASPATEKSRASGKAAEETAGTSASAATSTTSTDAESGVVSVTRAPAPEPETTQKPKTAKTTASSTSSKKPEDAGELPVPDYDSRTVASLRARMRNLSAAQVQQLLDYEKAHAARSEVITMYERRLAKLAEG